MPLTSYYESVDLPSQKYTLQNYTWLHTFLMNIGLLLKIYREDILPTGSEERGLLLGVGSIPVAILLSCQDIMKTYYITS